MIAMLKSVYTIARSRLPFAKRAYTDPVTGDRLTTGEYASWQVQHVMRRWEFLIITQVVTLICWVVGAWHGDVLTWWNLAASDFAVIVESLTAMVLIAQTLRDAVVTRQNRAIEQENRATMREMSAQIAAQGQQIAELKMMIATLTRAVQVGSASDA